MELSYENIKLIFEKYGYYAEDELIWQTYINLDKIVNGGQVGQDIHAICLEGPTGSGKTKYAKVYTKLLKDILGEEIEEIGYQCDSTTGKAELYEEIRISAAIVGNPDNVIIAGKLVEAIDKVNSGKKVILFLDEFDKAREDTDTFLYQFLQEGKINTTQRGDVEILSKYKKNLQVIICKNDKRKNLTIYLERRVKILRLTEMKPKNFYKVANRELPNADKDIINVVSVLYGTLYNNKDKFKRISSCPENLLAIMDACTLMKANAPEEFIYSAIISNMIKDSDDIETFRHLLGKDEKLFKFFKKSLHLRDEISNMTPVEEMRRQVLLDFFCDDIKRVSEDIKRANRMLTQVHIENDFLEETIQKKEETIAKQEFELQRKNKQIVEQQAYIQKLLQKSDKLVKTTITTEELEQDIYSEEKTSTIPNIIKIGEEHKFVQQEGIGGEIQQIPGLKDERIKIKESIFSNKQDIWQIFAYIDFRSYDMSINKDKRLKDSYDDLRVDIIQMTTNIMAQYFYDGMLIYDKDGIKVGITRVLEEEEKIVETNKKKNVLVNRHKFFANTLVLPSYIMKYITNYISVYCDMGGYLYSEAYINCLVASDEVKEPSNEEKKMYMQFTTVNDNIYNFKYKNRDCLGRIQADLYESFCTREYDNGEEAELRKIAITRHRQLLQTGKLNPASTEYIKPLVEPKNLVNYER